MRAFSTNPMPGATTYGRELFRRFTPSLVRPVSDAWSLELLSTSLYAELADALASPVVEVSFSSSTLLDGVFRAARHADAPVVVALSALEPGAAGLREEVRAVLECASDCGFDRPLSLVVRASPLTSVDDGELERAAERVLAILDVGATAFAFRPMDVVQDRALRFTRAVRPLLEWGLGIEVELFGTRDDALFMSELDEIGVPLAALRGASVDDELCGARLVVDPLKDALPADLSRTRVVLDGFLLRAARDVLSEAEGLTLFAAAADDTGRALKDARPLFDELPRRERDRLEALVYGNVSQALARTGASGAGDRLLDALAVELYADGGPAEAT